MGTRKLPPGSVDGEALLHRNRQGEHRAPSTGKGGQQGGFLEPFSCEWGGTVLTKF